MTCGDCLYCLARVGTRAKAAPCDRLVSMGFTSVYVELDMPSCEGAVPRSLGGPWSEEQLSTLLDCAARMTSATGHGLRDCVEELRRAVRAEYMARSSDSRCEGDR